MLLKSIHTFPRHSADKRERYVIKNFISRNTWLKGHAVHVLYLTVGLTLDDLTSKGHRAYKNL